MTWENIEERLKKVFTVKVSFPAGTVWLPDAPLKLREWLLSAAQTDVELRELNIPRIRFLQNRWRVERLVQIKWDKPFDRRGIWAVFVGSRAYILFAYGADYQVVAALEPSDQPALYQAVISKLLSNTDFVPTGSHSIKIYRPDLLPDAEMGIEHRPEEPLARRSRKRGYISDLLVGWIGQWINLPVLGFWHQDAPDSVRTVDDGHYVIEYHDNLPHQKKHPA